MKAIIIYTYFWLLVTTSSEAQRDIENACTDSIPNCHSLSHICNDSAIKELCNSTCGICISAQAATCPDNFSPVGENSCLKLDLSMSLTWEAARTYCQGLGGDLAVFKDIGHYADALKYIGEFTHDNSKSVWIGGSDKGLENRWLWINGDDVMPMGAPFWGSRATGHDSYAAEPSGGAAQACCVLYAKNRYYMHDVECNKTAVPLCQNQL